MAIIPVSRRSSLYQPRLPAQIVAHRRILARPDGAAVCVSGFVGPLHAREQMRDESPVRLIARNRVRRNGLKQRPRRRGITRFGNRGRSADKRAYGRCKTH